MGLDMGSFGGALKLSIPAFLQTAATLPDWETASIAREQCSYIGFACTYCNEPIIVLTIPRGAQQPDIIPEIVYFMPCGACRADNVCSAPDLVRFEAEQVFI